MAEAFGVAASALAVAELSVKVASLCLQYSKDVKRAAEDIDRVYKEVCNLKAVSEAVKKLLKGANGKELEASQQLLTTLQDGVSRLQGLESKLSPGQGHRVMSKFGLRALRWPFERKDAEKIIQDLVRCTQTISLSLQIDQAVAILDLGQTLVLDKLPIAIDAAFDSHAEERTSTCLPDTRVDLLHGIYEWANENQSKTVFWLNGAAGTGKSTISRTVSQKFSADGRLGASFFFKRGEGDRGLASKFFTTVAAQLIKMEPVLAPYIKDAIDTEPAIIGKTLQEQFDRLILQPLARVPKNTWKADTFVIVVDALDECEEEDAKTIINLFSSTNRQFRRLRIFITSRPDLPMQLGFGAVQGTYQDLLLHEVPEQVIEHDLSIYFKHELASIRDNYNRSVPQDRQLPSNWPVPPKVQTLVTMANPLFIFAATVCRFLADRKCGNPDQQLRTVLEYETRSQESKLDATYLPVLNRMLEGLSKREKTKAMQDFRDVVGSIVILASPLSTSALARLLDTDPEVIDSRLDWLHSVLSIPSSRELPVRLLHLSFRDFLLDPEKAEQDSIMFWINEKEAHEAIAGNCFRVMNERLRKDICELKWPGTSRSSINAQVISDRLTPEFRYACLYWAHHVQQAGRHIFEDKVYCFLRQHLLHWLEALNLIGSISESLRNLMILKSLVQAEPGRCIQLSDFIDDAIRFVRTNISTIQDFPLQVYCSALASAPKSIIRNTFQSDIPDWISLGPQVNTHWSSCLQVLQGHSNWVSSVAFSPPDGGIIASGSFDGTIRLWSADIGEHLQTLQGHSDIVTSVAFSPPDGRIIASSSRDGTVRLWSAETGEHLKTLQGCSNLVTPVAFSPPDGRIIASSSNNGTVRLWLAETGEHLQTLEGHASEVTSVVFSPPDGRIIASSSRDGTIRLWLAETGKHLRTLEGHASEVTSVAFSPPDGRIIASGSYDNTVRLWLAETGEHLRTLEGHASEVTSVAFSPLDGGIIALGSGDWTVRLWSAKTYEHLQLLRGHTNTVTSVAFSPDGKIIMSGSADETVRLWSAKISAQSQMLQCHTAKVQAVRFSPNGRIVASGSRDNTVRLWSADTGEHLQTFTGHTRRIAVLAFSPNSRIIASGSYDRTVRLWSADGEHLQTLEGHLGWVKCIVFSPNCSTVASSAWDKTVKLWSVDTGQHLRTFEGLAIRASVLAISPDGRTIASESSGTILLWPADGGEHSQMRTLAGHKDGVASVVFSPNGSTLASSSYDHTIRLWSVETGDCLRSVDCPMILDVPLSFQSYDRFLLGTVGDVSCLDYEQERELRNRIAVLDSDSWITFNGKNLFRLPVEFRRPRWDVFDSSVALGTEEGRVIIMRFSTERLVELCQFAPQS